jgi:hypothetical protein
MVFVGPMNVRGFWLSRLFMWLVISSLTAYGHTPSSDGHQRRRQQTASGVPKLYTLLDNPVTWAEAEAGCRQRGNRLASIHTLAEQLEAGEVRHSDRRD